LEQFQKETGIIFYQKDAFATLKPFDRAVKDAVPMPKKLKTG
jgi:hypothetical protein